MPPNTHHQDHHGNGGHGPSNERAGLVVAPLSDPARQSPKLLGATTIGLAELVGLSVPDARHHIHVQGVTGVGKSTWLAHHVLGEAEAGRGVVLLDPQGDLATNVIDRLPADCGDRLVILDPDEHDAPAAFNVLHATDPGQRALVADGVVSVFRRLYAASWGPRMDDLMRAACLTLIRREGSTLADIVPLLQNARFRREVLAEVGEPEGLEGFWPAFNEATPAQRGQLVAPVTSRLRSVLTRPFARTLLGAGRSSFTLTDVLDGGVLIARLPKGGIGEDCSRLVGSLLIARLWQEITRRATRPPGRRPDATIVVDECHNFLNMPIGVDDALAEARGYRVSWVLAHQHQAQLPPDVREGIDANARTKVYFTVSPDDARRLVRHVAPDIDEHGLRRRPAFQVVARAVADGRDTPACTLDTLPLPPAPPGRGTALRRAARARTGQSRQARGKDASARRLDTTPAASTAAHALRQHWNTNPSNAFGDSNSVNNSAGNPWATYELPTELPPEAA
ncbi:type IV secretory system conjugative DNA transfer family protein [Amycolatopsis sp. cmx-4-68]|uniref:type IV secretory system conjugative DNA transfer family protein n=1 Tax=Amycolatopsis sp. cmx-4-68 TaxID=2790938 RepID=UPI00397902A6